MKVITDFRSIAIFAGVCSAVSAIAGAAVGILVDRRVTRRQPV